MKRTLIDVDKDLAQLEKVLKETAAAQMNDTLQPISSEKELIAIGSRDLQNKVALENPRFLKKRFGVSRPKEQSWHLITLQNQLDLTDEEMRNMTSSKVITCEKGKNTVVEADRVLFYMGWVMLALLGFRFIPILALFFFIKVPVTKLFLGASSCIALWIIPSYFCYRHAIQPIRTLQQRGLKLGEALIFNGRDFSRS